MNLLTIRKAVVPLLVIAHLTSALYYTSFSPEIKNSNQIAFILFNNPVTYISAFSLWFFGSEFLFVSALMFFASQENKSPIEKEFITLETIHLGLRGVLYALNYSEILSSDLRHRHNFLVGYIFLLSLHYVYKFSKK